ncbi:lysophospholipase L1-like esterase [Chitinophaga dinghuensis]|uniref:Lysophospholipase L1-like esterase n=1 Tax=Chitinophaga dinghuensis TaxID=1539050 RepID=A0A327WER4_9BACT|nr:GDSL-type esterase/lipase family protein [Chitinophaga dinghuensis]RAJ88051.1 lysophospholipase L1-like esterase [Chitinophaga dinghuensis]
MKKRSSLFLLLALLLFPSTVTAQRKIIVSCLGTSITYGAGMYNREKNNYPQQLQYLLGNNYEVHNYGVNGATLLDKGNKPYRSQPAYEQALSANSDIIFLEFGTNDSKQINWQHKEEFVQNYKALIGALQKKKHSPRIILLLPVPSYLKDSTSINDSIIRTQIHPFIQQVAYETGVELINLYPGFIGQPDLLPDQIHPSSIGAAMIARRLYEAVKVKEDPRFNIYRKMHVATTGSSFYGYACYDFTYAGRNCKIVQPRVTAAGRPWVWRARFWGHEPQTDIAMLERGYHIVYCDVVEMFGNQTCIDIWNKYYQFLTGMGLHKKALLEGMSRGGIYIYNWAQANPDKVAGIYADAPQLDFRSWPRKGSLTNWEIFKQQYHLTEEQALHFTGAPLDHAEAIAKMGFPMLHAVGDADSTVPVAENTALFEQRIKAAGGNITVIHKPGVAHHPHSLANPKPIVDFMLQATGHKINFAVLPVPGAEYRKAAGWKIDNGWWEQHADIDSLLQAQKGQLDIVFAGNSITQGLGGHRTRTTNRAGFQAFDSTFSKWKWECAGISGDRVQNLLWRLQNGQYKQSQPKVLVVTIGVNNFGDNDSGAEIAAGILEIANWVKRNMPGTKLLLTGLLPTGFTPEEPRRQKYNEIHQVLAAANHDGYTYLPLTSAFTNSDGTLDAGCYAKDGIHLTAEGYRRWAAALSPQLEKMLAK